MKGMVLIMKKILFVGLILLCISIHIWGSAADSEKSGTILPSVWMYSGSVSSQNETDTVKSGDMIAEVEIGTKIKSNNIIVFFAIYSQDGKLIDLDTTRITEATGENVLLKIEDFEATVGENYSAKVFLWDENLTPLCDSIKLTNKTKATDYVDFVVEVEEGSDITVLQLTDTQIEDSDQVREGTTLRPDQIEHWKPEKMNENCFDICRQTIEKTNPDLILITGDLVYGRYDDNGTSLMALIDFMESIGIPWAPVFGNHDNESYKGADWQCKMLENAEHCLFKQRTLTGNGNYSVGITQGGELKRVFFMLDSNGCSSMSEQTIANGHSKKSAGFGQDQIDWYTNVTGKISAKESDMNYTFAFHIQPLKFKDAFEKYGFTNSGTKENPINIDTHAGKAERDFGYIGRDLKDSWDADYAVYNGMKALGIDSILVGHEHCNSASVVYDGVRFQYGQKSSSYDRVSFLKADGTIEGAAGSYTSIGEPILGGTVMKLSKEDGTIDDAYIYYYKYEPADDDLKEETEIKVNGLQVSTGNLYPAADMQVETVKLNGVNAYKLTPTTRCKFYVNTELIKNKNVFKFSTFLPESSTSLCVKSQGEFALRVKPNNIEPVIDGTTDGYIIFRSKSTNDKVNFVHGEWKTFEIDISSLGTSCTEFAFDFADNVIYLKDIVIE